MLRDKSHEIKNVTDFNVVDSVRRDIEVLVTKTRYTVHTYAECCFKVSRATKFPQLLLAKSSLPLSYYRPCTQHSIMNYIRTSSYCSYQHCVYICTDYWHEGAYTTHA